MRNKNKKCHRSWYYSSIDICFCCENSGTTHESLQLHSFKSLRHFLFTMETFSTYTQSKYGDKRNKFACLIVDFVLWQLALTGYTYWMPTYVILCILGSCIHLWRRPDWGNNCESTNRQMDDFRTVMTCLKNGRCVKWSGVHLHVKMCRKRTDSLVWYRLPFLGQQFAE